MIAILLVAIAITAVFLVLKPLFSAKKVQPLVDRRNDPTLVHHDLVAEKLKIYSHIKDIDLEYRMGKIEEADYRKVRGEYLQQASVVLDKLQKLDGRFGPGRKRDPKTEEKVIDSVSGECPKCGTNNPADHKFCSECGESLVSVVAEGR